MDFSLNINSTRQQRQWVRDAIALCQFPLDSWRIGLPVTVEWTNVDDPETDNFAEYMTTSFVTTDGNEHAVIAIATNADSMENSAVQALEILPWELQNWYMESFIHEIGHVVFGWYFGEAGTIARVAEMYERNGQQGTAADWSPPGNSWENRIVEGNAEFFKDVFMPPGFRVFDNRTNWWMKRSDYGTWLDMLQTLVCPYESQDQ